MLRYRILSAIIGIPLGLLVVWVGGLWLTGLILLLALLGFYEYHATLRLRGFEALREIGFPAVAALVLGAHFLSGEALLAFLQAVLALVVIGSMAFHILVSVDGSRVASAAATVFGVAYVGFLFTFLVLVRQMPGPAAEGAPPFGLRLFLVVWLATWGADTGAYTVGKTLGKRRLCPAISPGKTVEGAVGGLFGALLVASLLGWWAGFQPDHALPLGLLVALVGLVGDLSKSVLKRDIGVKDFGALIPGHGGVLDRFDSLLVTMPAAYFYAGALMG